MTSGAQDQRIDAWSPLECEQQGESTGLDEQMDRRARVQKQSQRDKSEQNEVRCDVT